MKKPLAIGIGLFLLALLLLFSMTYSVSYYEVAIKKTFGQATEQSIETEPGLKFKLPIFADQVAMFDTRLQIIETSLETIPTADGQQLLARTFLLWQVDREGNGPLRFEQSYPTIDAANQAILDQLKTAATSSLSRYEFADLLGPESRLADAEEAILSNLSDLREHGIVPRTVGVSQVLLPPRTTQAVLQRMEATREALADAERFRGNAEAERIESEARSASEKILAFADRRAQEIRAAGDREAARYIEQMGEDEELALFLLYTDSLREFLSDQTTFVLDTQIAPWHLMQLGSRTDARGIPQPERAIAGFDAPLHVATNPDGTPVEDVDEAGQSSGGTDAGADDDEQKATQDDG